VPFSVNYRVTGFLCVHKQPAHSVVNHESHGIFLNVLVRLLLTQILNGVKVLEINHNTQIIFFSLRILRGTTIFPFRLQFLNDVLLYFQCLNGIQLDF